MVRRQVISWKLIELLGLKWPYMPPPIKIGEKLYMSWKIKHVDVSYYADDFRISFFAIQYDIYELIVLFKSQKNIVFELLINDQSVGVLKNIHELKTWTENLPPLADIDFGPARATKIEFNPAPPNMLYGIPLLNPIETTYGEAQKAVIVTAIKSFFFNKIGLRTVGHPFGGRRRPRRTRKSSIIRRRRSSRY